MRDFGRVIRLAFRYRFSIVASVACSLMVGILWGGNIAALYPFVEVVFRGESFHEWADNRVTDRQRIVRELSETVDGLEDKLKHASGEEETSLRELVDSKTRRLESEQGTLANAQKHKRLITTYLPDDPFLDLVLVVGALMLGTILKTLFLAAHVILVARIRQQTIFDLRNRFFSKTLDMDLAAFGENRTSTLLSRFTFDVKILEDGLGGLFGQAVREPLKMTACLVGAAFISWQLLLLSLVVAPLGLLGIHSLTRAMKRATGRSMDVISELYARLSESFNGIKVVKAFTMEGHECRRFEETGREYVRRMMRFSTCYAFLKPVSETMAMGVVSMAILSGAYLVLNQETHVFGLRICDEPLSPAALLVFFGMLAGIADPVRKLSDIYAMLIGGMMAAGRVYELMDRVPQVADPAQPKVLPRPHQRLTLDHVNFHYQEGEPVLKDVSLSVGFGETIAFLGPNGCGKSTLVNLVPRFYDPVGGSVRLDDVDLRELSLRDLRKSIGLVTQETLLFDDTVLNNIRYGAPDASEEQVIEAAKQAYAHEFITDVLEEGYQTVVGEGGGRLSGGQRQRISLARAILRDPEILILDEATSQIDIESEQLIHKTLEQFARGRTTLLISHRLSTLALADRIVVMDNGQIIECGTHDDLIARCDFYRRLHQSQMGDAA